MLSEVAKYYFDGHGKALRPVLTSTMASAVNHHLQRDPNDEVCFALTTVLNHMLSNTSCLMQVLSSLQSRVVLAAEMYHTASLMHDDVSLGRVVGRQ